jgi:hypothetical protein
MMAFSLRRQAIERELAKLGAGFPNQAVDTWPLASECDAFDPKLFRVTQQLNLVVRVHLQRLTNP